MTIGKKILAALLALGVVSGCGGGVRDHASEPEFESVTLDYDVLELEFLDPPAAVNSVEHETGAEAAGEAASMILFSPIGCMQAGMFYGLCLAVMPIMPFVAASRVQDPAESVRQLEELARAVDAYRLPERFGDAVRQRIVDEGLPLVDQAGPDQHAVRLQVLLGAMRLEHDGYEHGDITVEQAVEFVLRGPDGSILHRLSDTRSGRFGIGEWQARDGAELRFRLDQWLAGMVEAGVESMLLDWQPYLRLAAVSPQIEYRRNLIGLKVSEWPVLDTLTPVLEWQPLEEVLDPAVLADVTDISYEVEVSLLVQDHTDWGYVTRRIRAARGLTRPEYPIDAPLPACQRMYWRPRARFRYRGTWHTTTASNRHWQSYVLMTSGPECDYPAWTKWIDEAPSEVDAYGRPIVNSDDESV